MGGFNRSQGCVSCSPFSGALKFGPGVLDSSPSMPQQQQHTGRGESSSTFGLTSTNAFDSLPSEGSRMSRGVSPRPSQYSPRTVSPRQRPNSVAGDTIDGSHVAHHSASLQRSLCTGKTAGLLRCHTAAASLERSRSLPGMIKFVNNPSGPLSAATFVNGNPAFEQGAVSMRSLESQRLAPRDKSLEIAALIESLAPSHVESSDMHHAEALMASVQRPSKGKLQRKRTQEVWRGGWGTVMHVDQQNALEENMPISLRKNTRQLMDDIQNMASFAPRSGLKSQGPCPDWQLGETVGSHSRQTALGRRMMVTC